MYSIKIDIHFEIISVLKDKLYVSITGQQTI